VYINILQLVMNNYAAVELMIVLALITC